MSPDEGSQAEGDLGRVGVTRGLVLVRYELKVWCRA
jgi:hypothetical protein